MVVRLRRGPVPLIGIVMILQLIVSNPSVAAGSVAGQERSPIDWPQFHLTPDHRGFNPFETVLSPSTVGGLTEKWSIQPVAFASIQNPVLVGGVLYVGAYLATPSSGNRVYAIDAASGQILWTTVATQDGFANAPAVADGLVFAVDAFPGSLYAFDQATGATVWTARIADGGAYQAQPTVSHGLVFVNSPTFPGKLLAFDAATGTEQWEAPAENLLIGPPVVAGDTVYVGGQEGTLYAFRASTGAPLWKAPVALSGFTGIAVSDGVVFAGNQDHSVYALDAATGATVWTRALGYEIYSSPAVAYGTVFIGTLSRWLMALDASTGRVRWGYDSGSSSRYFPGSPSVASGVVYEGEYTAALHAFDASTGALLWSSPLVAQDVGTSPIVVDGFVYATTSNGYVVAFGL